MSTTAWTSTPTSTRAASSRAKAKAPYRWTTSRTTVWPSSRCIHSSRERLTQLLDDSGRCTQPNQRAVVMMSLGEHGRTLVRHVHDPLVRPRHVDLRFFECADEVLDEPIAKP